MDKDVAHLMETPVQENTTFKCTRRDCGCEIEVTHVPKLPVVQPFTCVCGGQMEQVSTPEAIAGG